MSDLQIIAQQISGLMTNAENAVTQVRTYTRQINEMIAFINNAMRGTNQRECQELINQLNVSKVKLNFAAESFVAAKKSGSDWLGRHVHSGASASIFSSNYADASSPLDGDSETHSNGNEYHTSEDAKVKRMSKEDAQELYKNGLDCINERLDNHKEALMERGVPDGEWLRKTLAIEKALMTQQLANDIDVARGFAEPQVIYNADDGTFKLFDDFAASYFKEKSDVGPCIDWKTQPDCNTTNLNLNLNKTNPNYLPHSEWSINCQRCVPTYEMRRRGYDVTALPRLNSNDYLCSHPFAVWENPDILSTTGTGYDSIVNKMSEWGDGARAQIVVAWAGTPLGHTFIAENLNGVVKFIDPQNGDEDCSQLFNNVELNNTLFCRIDNLVPSNYILDCCSEV